MLLFLNIISLYIEAFAPSFHRPLKTSSMKFFGLLSEPGGDFPFYSFIVGKMFSRKMMFKRAEQMEVGAIRRMLEVFPLEISQRLIHLVGSMGARVDATYFAEYSEGEYPISLAKCAPKKCR
jgi:hypothetical protein